MPRAIHLDLPPSIDEVRTVLRDQIQSLIDGHAIPTAKQMDAIRRGQNWKPALKQVKDQRVRYEIACLGRALELLDAVQELNLKELAKALDKKLSDTN